MNKKVLLLTYEGPRFGGGHKKRCLSIKLELEKLGVSASLRIISEICDFDTLSNIDSNELLLVDIPLQLQKFIGENLQERSFFALDWSETTPIPEINFAAFVSSNLTYPSKRLTLSGPEYLVIPDFEQCQGEKKKEFDVLVVLGANPNPEKLDLAIDFAMSLGDKVVVIGHTAPKRYEKNRKVKYLGFIDEPITFMQKARNVISNSGITLLQSLFVGVSTYSWPQNSQEIDFLRNFVCKLTSVTELVSENGNLVVAKSDSSHALKLWEVTDGRGASRIARNLLHNIEIA